MDATLATLARLQDPSLWDVVKNVPIFTVHKVVKKGPDGKPQTIAVSEADLHRIVQMARHQEGSAGVSPRITLGHMHLPRETPESQQPAPIGYGRNLRVGRWGPAQKLGILADLCFARGRKPAPGDYPYRSVEYYPDTGEITGIALLRRDPELDLGMVTYERSDPTRGACYCYTRDDMADAVAEKTPPATPGQGIEPTGQPDASAPDPEFQEHFMRCMRHSFPHMEKMHAQYAASAAPAAPATPAPAMPSATNGAVPEPEKGEQYMRQAYPELYQRWQADRAALAKAQVDNAATAQRVNVLQYERELRELRDDQGYPIDLKAELEEVKVQTPEQFAAYKKSLVRHYADRQGPAQYALDPRAIATSGRQNQPAQLTEAQYDKAVQYLRDKGCSWDEAETWAKTN